MLQQPNAAIMIPSPLGRLSAIDDRHGFVGRSAQSHEQNSTQRREKIGNFMSRGRAVANVGSAAFLAKSNML